MDFGKGPWSLDDADRIICGYRRIGGTVARQGDATVCTAYGEPCMVITVHGGGRCTVRRYPSVPKRYADAVARAEEDAYEPCY